MLVLYQRPNEYFLIFNTETGNGIRRINLDTFIDSPMSRAVLNSSIELDSAGVISEGLIEIIRAKDLGTLLKTVRSSNPEYFI